MPLQPQVRRVGLLFVLCAQAAYGHDAFEIWTAARVRPTEVELQVTMSRSTAFTLIKDGAPGVQFIDYDNFDALRPLLKTRAAGFYVLSSDGATLTFREASAELTVEVDVEFRIVYSHPDGRKLLLNATMLTNLTPEFGTTVSVCDEKENILGWELLTGESPSLEVGLPAAMPASATNQSAASGPPAPLSSGVPAKAGSVPSAERSPSDAARPHAGVWIAGGLLALGIFSWLVAKKRVIRVRQVP